MPQLLRSFYDDRYRIDQMNDFLLNKKQILPLQRDEIFFKLAALLIAQFARLIEISRQERIWRTRCGAHARETNMRTRLINFPPC